MAKVMKWCLGVSAALLLATSNAYTQPPSSPADIALASKRDSYAQFIALENLGELLRDPDSLKTDNVNTFRYGAITERAVCGVYNAKNGTGSYAGRKPFISRVTFAPREYENLRVDAVMVTQAAIQKYCVRRAP